MSQVNDEARRAAQLVDPIAVRRVDTEDPCHDGLEIARQFQLGEHGQVRHTLTLGNRRPALPVMRIRRIHPDLEPAIAGHPGGLARPALTHGLINVLNVIAGKPAVKLEDDPVEAVVGASTDRDKGRRGCIWLRLIDDSGSPLRRIGGIQSGIWLR
ncbi:hypothetical protein [Marinobacter sp.]|uniref:hypothetical protein n=1 Tax=Marinobacter sp. TaxID=50741 RepID=UPI00385074A4